MGEKRDLYVEKLKSKLDEWNTEIDKLEAKGDRVNADARVELASHLAELRAKRSAAEEEMSKLRKAGEAAWEDLKAGADITWQALGEAVKSATSRFKELQ